MFSSSAQILFTTVALPSQFMSQFFMFSVRFSAFFRTLDHFYRRHPDQEIW